MKILHQNIAMPTMLYELFTIRVNMKEAEKSKYFDVNLDIMKYSWCRNKIGIDISQTYQRFAFLKSFLVVSSDNFSGILN